MIQFVACTDIKQANGVILTACAKAVAIGWHKFDAIHMLIVATEGLDRCLW